MSQSIPDLPQLLDIPLNVDGQQQGDTLGTLDKITSKTNSLKRFFKLPKKSSDLDAIEASSGGEQLMEKSKSDDVENGTTKEAKEKERIPMKRFHLRLGGASRYVDEEHAPSKPSSSSGGNNNNSNIKSTLKGSISNYWHNVFKRGNSKNTNASANKTDVDENDHDDADSEEETVNENMVGDISVHNLSISDENQSKN